MLLLNAEKWSSDKDMMHATRSEVNVDSFAETDFFCKNRVLLECERIFFQ